MAEVQIEMADVQAVLNSNQVFAQAVQSAALARRIDELEAEKAEAPPACNCTQYEDLAEDETDEHE